MLIIAAIVALFATQSPPANESVAKLVPIVVQEQDKMSASVVTPSPVISPNGGQ